VAFRATIELLWSGEKITGHYKLGGGGSVRSFALAGEQHRSEIAGSGIATEISGSVHGLTPESQNPP